MRPWIALLVFLAFEGCLGDLYGGDPRIQLRNRSGAVKVVDVRLGETSRPAWKHEFDPQVDSGGISEIVELPAAGRLRLAVRVAGGSLDTVVEFERTIPVGGFCQVELAKGSDGLFRLKD